MAGTTTATDAQTPAARPRRRSELPGPASPADIADVVEHESAKLAASLTDLYSVSGIAQAIEGVRERCSSVTGIQITFLLLECFALQRDLIPWRFAADTPALALLGLPSISLYYPDFFVLLTGHYWATTLLWGSTSIFIPVLFAYFYNLTIRHVKRNNARVAVVAYTADPLTYNIVKALATWIVYVQGVSFGVLNARAADRVDAAVYGGANGILIGSGVGVLATLYEAALRKPVV